MAWTAPMTAVANAVFTAAQFNTHVRDNLLETAPAKATAAAGIFVTTGANAIAERFPTAETQATSGTTTSTSYVTALTGGTTCDVSVNTGTQAIVIIRGNMTNATATNTTFLAYDISGASTIAAADARSVSVVNSGTAGGNTKQGVFYQTGLTAGLNTFTLQHRSSAATTATYTNREIIVIPL